MTDNDDLSAHPTAAVSFVQRLVLLVVLAGLIVVGLAHLRPPPVVSKDAPRSEFSAERAMDELGEIATESRAIGTPGHDVARDYLIGRIEELGLMPEVQTVPVHVRFPGSPGFSAGVVNNVVVRLRGEENTGAIVVNAHYDSGTTGPGASDCGSCVVTALESMRAMVNSPPLRNDVIFVFSDGEENGDLGAAAFVREHRWASDVRLAINYEAQGSGGPAILYATSEQDGWLVSEFLRVSPHVSAYSLIGAISELYPAGQLECDLAEYMKGGVQGLGFVYTSDTVDYHTVRDNLARIDPRSVQQEGDYTVAFLRHFGNLDISDPPRWQNRVFFTAWPGHVLHYPYGWVIPLAILITALGLALILFGMRRGKLEPKPLAAATGALAVGALVIMVATVFVWFAIKRLNPVYDVVLIGHYQTRLYTAAFIMLDISMVAGLHVLTRRWGTGHLSAAAFVVWLPLLWLLTVATPGLSYIATWPLLFALGPLVWTVVRRPHGWGFLGVLVVAAVPAIVLLPGTLYQTIGLLNRFEGATGLPLLGGLALFVVPVLLLLLPHFEMLAGSRGEQRHVIGVALGVLAVSLIAWCNLTVGYDEARPRPDHVAYLLDADRAEARWVSFDRHLDDWTEQFFGSDAVRASHQTPTWGTFEAFTADARVVDLPAPEVVLVGNEVVDGRRLLSLRFASPRGASEMRVRIDASAPITRASLDARELALEEYGPARTGVLRFNYVNVPAEGFPLELAIASTGEVKAIVEDSTLGLPAELNPPARPSDTMPAPLFRRDATDVRKTFTF
jgi:hypothetical protein